MKKHFWYRNLIADRGPVWLLRKKDEIRMNRRKNLGIPDEMPLICDDYGHKNNFLLTNSTIGRYVQCFLEKLQPNEPILLGIMPGKSTFTI